tara:strand:+ start:64 stop:282 length:219 start_codon:yes stop_codon:yes gene_type:complete
MKEGKMNKQTNRKNNMNYKFNEDQINIIQHCLDIQEDIWLKNKSNREYYDADLRRLKECKDIINQQASKQKG